MAVRQVLSRVGPEVWGLTRVVMLVAARWVTALLTTDKVVHGPAASVSSLARAAAKV